MSRSRKKPIIKDKSGHKWYNRLIKRAVRQVVRQIKYLKDKEDYTIPHLYEKVNQYDICDWWFDCQMILKHTAKKVSISTPFLLKSIVHNKPVFLPVCFHAGILRRATVQLRGSRLR